MTSWPRFAFTLLLVFGSAGLAVPAHADDSARGVVSIAHARALPLGAVVTIDGTATTPSGAFESSFFDKGFGLQDRSAGIYVSVQDDPHIAPRTEVRVTGTLRDSFGLLILVPDGPAMVKTHGKGPRIHPRLLPTGAINEASEGRLVRVVGTVAQAPVSDLPFGSKFFVNDGSGEITIFVNVQTNIVLTSLTIGQTVSVTGFSSQFDTHFEIDPRFPADIGVASNG